MKIEKDLSLKITLNPRKMLYTLGFFSILVKKLNPLILWQWLNLRWVHELLANFFQCIFVPKESTNLAFNKPSLQSGSDSWYLLAHLANDGNRNPDMLNGDDTCIQTASVNEPLWSVDLQATYSISYVRFNVQYQLCSIHEPKGWW